MKFSEISILDIFNFFVALASFVVAVIALISSKQIELDVADYEFTLSQTPKLCILNQEFQIPLKMNSDISIFELIVDDNATDDIYDLTECFPIKIPIYNIGIGLAQNCKIKFSCVNQKRLALSCREIFKSCGLNEDLYYSDIIPTYRYEYFLYNYEYIFDEDNLIKVEWKRNFVTVASNDFSKDYVYNYPYILPISEEKSNVYFEIPEEFSVLILEAMFQEMDSTYNLSFEPIELEVEVTYQDLKNNEYCHRYLLKFSILSDNASDSELLLQIGLGVDEIIER